MSWLQVADLIYYAYSRILNSGKLRKSTLQIVLNIVEFGPIWIFNNWWIEIDYSLQPFNKDILIF